jgi:tetratricopeptide (TPR) repeat protein
MKTELTKAFVWLWLCLLSLIAIPSCSSRPHIDSRLIEAEHIMNAHPDSALQMVRGVRPRTSVDSAYALYLAARAKDKLHIRDVDVDSLQEAVDFLETLPLADEEKALMHYYTGINYYRKDSLRRSVQEYYKCLDYQTDTCTKLGYKTYEYLGECFYEGHLYKEALEYYKTAASVATRLNDSLGMCILEDYVAFTHFILEDYDSAVAYCNHSIQLSEARSDSLHLATSYNTKAAILDHLGRVEEALQYTNKAFSFYPKSKEVPMAFYITKCDIWIHMNRWDSVEVCLRHWQDYKENQRTLRDLYERYYRKSKQDSVSAIQILYADSVMHYQEQYSKDLKQVSPLLQRLHDSYQVARQQRSQSQADTHLYIIGALVVLLLMFGIYYYRHTHAARTAEASPTAPGQITREQLREAESQMFAPCAEADLLKSLQQKSDLTITQEQRQALMQHLMKVLTPTIQTLQQEYPKLNSEHSLICLLSYYGFATGACAALFNSNDSAVRQRKYRLKSILTEADFQFFFKK